MSCLIVSRNYVSDVLCSFVRLEALNVFWKHSKYLLPNKQNKNRQLQRMFRLKHNVYVKIQFLSHFWIWPPQFIQEGAILTLCNEKKTENMKEKAQWTAFVFEKWASDLSYTSVAKEVSGRTVLQALHWKTGQTDAKPYLHIKPALEKKQTQLVKHQGVFFIVENVFVINLITVS